MSAKPQERGEAIAEAAAALCRVFRDERSFKHYCRVLHRAVAAEFAGVAAFARLQAAMTRVEVDMREIQLDRPGGRLVRELQTCGWWDEVYRAA
jgi:hypothetical protein